MLTETQKKYIDDHKDTMSTTQIAKQIGVRHYQSVSSYLIYIKKPQADKNMYKGFEIVPYCGYRAYIICKDGERASALHLNTQKAAKNVIDTYLANTGQEYTEPLLDNTVKPIQTRPITSYSNRQW